MNALQQLLGLFLVGCIVAGVAMGCAALIREWRKGRG